MDEPYGSVVGPRCGSGSLDGGQAGILATEELQDVARVRDILLA